MPDFRIAPVDEGFPVDFVSFNRSDKSGSVICGQLEYVSDSGGVFLFKGIANGQLIVNFSRGGRITGRIQQTTVSGSNYTYDTRNYSFDLGFTCL